MRRLDAITDEFEQALGDGEGQGSLVCCSPCSGKSQIRLNDDNNKRTKDTWGRYGWMVEIHNENAI